MCACFKEEKKEDACDKINCRRRFFLLRRKCFRKLRVESKRTKKMVQENSLKGSTFSGHYKQICLSATLSPKAKKNHTFEELISLFTCVVVYFYCFFFRSGPLLNDNSAPTRL